MFEVTVTIRGIQDHCGKGEHTTIITPMQVAELEFLTMSAIAAKEGRAVNSWTLEDMARLFCGCSSAGIDLFLAEYGKKRVEEKRKEARKLVIEGP